MKRYARAAALILALAFGSAQARPPDQYGPEPDGARYVAVAEPAVLAKMPDPDNWNVEWPNGYMPYTWVHRGRYPGYLTCGVLRAKVPPAKGQSAINFIVVVDHDQAKLAYLSSRDSNSLVNTACEGFVSQGRLPPARVLEEMQSRRATQHWGFEARAMPDGAYVTKVAPSSLAAVAGLLPGMVIAQANGVPLANLGAGMTAVLASDPTALQLQTVGGQNLKLAHTP